MAANDNNTINYKVNWPLFIQDPGFGQTHPWGFRFFWLYPSSVKVSYEQVIGDHRLIQVGLERFIPSFAQTVISKVTL